MVNNFPKLLPKFLSFTKWPSRKQTEIHITDINKIRNSMRVTMIFALMGK